MSSDYTPPTLVTPTKGGNAGDGTISGTLTLSEGWQILKGNGTQFTLQDTHGNTMLWINGSHNSPSFNLQTFWGNYNGVATKGLGLSPIYAAALRTALGTSSATVATYTPGAVGSFRVVWRLAAKAATTPTLTLTYTDPDAGAQTITLYDTAMAADGVAQGQFALVSAADAITVAGSALAASDIIATVEIIQSQ